MDWTTYLDHVRADAARLSEVANFGLDPDVPCCAGWTVRDLVKHVGTVYTHKALIVEEGWAERQDRAISPPDEDLVEWFDGATAHLLNVLADHDPAEPVWTWDERDRTVGFWYRRMAHETLIHRIDAEQAHGLASEIDEELAADGVDEILNVMMSGAPSWATLELGERVARLEIPGRSWTVRFGGFSGTSPTTGIVYTDEPTLVLVGPDTEFQTVVSGSAGALDKWLWGRASLGDLTVQGDRSIAAAIRGVAREATQ
jgi:uncharacterized protein (TIGR03083 family)